MITITTTTTTIIIIVMMMIITITTTTTTTTIIIIIIMIIAFKGAIRDFFYNLLTAPRTVSNTYAQLAWAQSCADMSRSTRALITHNMSYYLPHGTKGQLS